MKKFWLLSALLIVVLITAGCWTHTYDVGDGAPAGKQVHKKWNHHFLFAIIDSSKNKVDFQEVCPSGNATIKDEVSFVNGLVGALVGLIYYPSTVTILCDNGSAGQIKLTPEQQVAVAADPDFLEYVNEVTPETMPLAQVAVENAKAQN